MHDERTRMYRVRAVAEMLDVSVNTIYRAIETGELDALKIGKSLRIPSDALKVYVDRCGEKVHQGDVSTEQRTESAGSVASGSEVA